MSVSCSEWQILSSVIRLLVYAFDSAELGSRWHWRLPDFGVPELYIKRVAKLSKSINCINDAYVLRKSNDNNQNLHFSNPLHTKASVSWPSRKLRFGPSGRKKNKAKVWAETLLASAHHQVKNRTYICLQNPLSS
jgi:hypothetical protein